MAAVVVAAGVLVGCEGAGSSCTELRDELTSITSGTDATASWDEIAELQDDIGRVDELRAQLNARCDGPST